VPLMAQAAVSPRLRVTHTFHTADADPLQRLLNVSHPGTYVRPHCHPDPRKVEVFVVLSGRAAVVEFSSRGAVRDIAVLDPREGSYAVEILPGVWHNFFCLEEGTVFFEAKPGPYLPAADKRFPSWAPAEGTAAGVRYLRMLQRRAGMPEHRRNEISGLQARTLDARARDLLGLPALLLMENAGRALAETALRYLPSGKKVAVVCGRGNNGGDGLAAARHLFSRGVLPQVFLCRDKELTPEARVNFDALKALGVAVHSLEKSAPGRLRRMLSSASVIVDALYGVGLKGGIRGQGLKAVDAINQAKATVISADVPSGYDASAGRPLGRCVRATVTVTFAAAKKGMRSAEGRRWCGLLEVEPLGVAWDVIRNGR
jgi:hydroxyethylthiazole kinase-like uncharacterized protein yjeF